MTKTQVLLLREIFEGGTTAISGRRVRAAKELRSQGLVALSRHPHWPLARLTTLGRLLMSPEASS